MLLFKTAAQFLDKQEIFSDTSGSTQEKARSNVILQVKSKLNLESLSRNAFRANYIPFLQTAVACQLNCSEFLYIRKCFELTIYSFDSFKVQRHFVLILISIVYCH